MTDRYVKRDGYSIVVEEADSVEGVSSILESLFTAVNTGDAEIEETIQTMLSAHEGLEFVCISYYEHFIAPSMMRGFAILILFPVPDEDIDEDQRELIACMDDHELYQKALLVASPSNPAFISFVLEEEMTHLGQARVKMLRAL